MYKFFSISMSSEEARTKLFTIIENKTDEEIEEINSEYLKILPFIIEREIQEAKQGWLD